MARTAQPCMCSSEPTACSSTSYSTGVGSTYEATLYNILRERDLSASELIGHLLKRLM